MALREIEDKSRALAAGEGNESPLLSYEDVSRMLGLSLKALQCRVRRKTIPHIKLGAAVRFDAGEIRDWVNKSRVKANG